MAPTASNLLQLMIGDTVPRSVLRDDGRVGPAVPLGHRVELAGRGTTFVREVAGPKDAPTLLLLHGYMASAGLNWFRAFDALGEDFRVIAPDARGHARGLRSRRHMRLADCADDMAALIDVLDTGPVIAVGYSMGGPIAQLLWKRHPEKVAGLVLCATAPELGFGVRALNDAYLATVAGLTRTAGQLAAVPAAGANVLRKVRAHRPAGFLEWAAEEMRRHDVRMLTEAARSISRFDSRPWIREVDVPTTVLRTNRDRLVDPAGQTELATSIRGARIVDHDHGHFACARSTFAEPLVGACRDVAWRASA
jgi:pimeloyl-ACP methyl ester carboxylesterase